METMRPEKARSPAWAVFFFNLHALAYLKSESLKNRRPTRKT
jgi:hypothetical protein